MQLLQLLSVFSLALAPAPQREVRFDTQQIRDDFGVGYAVTVADVNGDQKPDILAISGTQLVWFENPSWQAHVVLDGETPKDNVTLAPHDIDRDGRPGSRATPTAAGRCTGRHRARLGRSLRPGRCATSPRSRRCIASRGRTSTARAIPN